MFINFAHKLFYIKSHNTGIVIFVKRHVLEASSDNDDDNLPFIRYVLRYSRALFFFSTLSQLTLQARNARKMHISATSRSAVALRISLDDGNNVFAVSELQISPAVWPHSCSSLDKHPHPNLALDISARKYGPLSTYRQDSATHVSRFPRWRMESFSILFFRFPVSRFHSFSVLLVCSAASTACPDRKLLHFDSSRGIKSALSSELHFIRVKRSLN